ncbi:DUF4870 domain-containing protein [Arenibacter sp. GZD96]|uniref:DUF4870 domain-containing protein n=1 Tax=Aurantibrevibacter litoralis TaxID=3106030 RepID=UPI002AFFB6F7|nr:DUF4870 domain-containing protein [Arenibacter sp. GZD-96]MEA1786029.1 DUF4870 domain-containing protein [Arenibacter sp. GZD-96]
MTETQTLSKHEKNLSALIHASTFSKYFFPFGNFIMPLILWTANKKENNFIDHNGKQALNFQISMLLYSIILGIITVPFIIGALPAFFAGHHFSFPFFFETNNFEIDFSRNGFSLIPFLWPIGISGIVYTALSVINFVYTILAVVKTSEGHHFKYPLTIPFIK